MKKIVIFIALLVFSVRVYAEPDYGEIAKFFVGSLSTIVVHEFSHAAVVEISGGDVYEIDLFKNGIFSGRVHANKINKYTAAAGLVSTSLLSEVIIRNDKWHDDSFAQGFVFFSLLSNIWQVKNYYTKEIGVGGYHGNDIDVYEMRGGNPHILSALLIGYSAYAIHRINKDTDMTSYAKRNLFGVRINF